MDMKKVVTTKRNCCCALLLCPSCHPHHQHHDNNRLTFSGGGGGGGDHSDNGLAPNSTTWKRLVPLSSTSSLTSRLKRRLRRHHHHPRFLIISSRFRLSQLLVLLTLFLSCSSNAPLSQACYLFPAGMPDPCADKACLFGSRCVASADGHVATCECPTSCPNYGDSDDSQPVCGSNGVNYRNKCELDREACRQRRNITVRYEGRCGK